MHPVRRDAIDNSNQNLIFHVLCSSPCATEAIFIKAHSVKRSNVQIGAHDGFAYVFLLLNSVAILGSGASTMANLITSPLKTPLGKYVVGVLLAWGLLFAVGYFVHGSTPGHPVLHVFFGFLLGMLSMYIATRIYRPREKGADR